MWYWWTALKKADIAPEVRARFESMGTAMVSQLLTKETYLSGGAIGGYVSTFADQKVADYALNAVAWLQEQHSFEERRHDRGEAVEILILVLVGVEAIPVAAPVFGWCWRTCGGN